MKRVFDILVTIFLMVLCFPVFILLYLSVIIVLGSPVFFCQQRPGLGGRLFTLVKFRTMDDTRDENGHLLDDRKRLTHFGRFLRATSLDELPEFYNVLKGEMSLVGPRPLLAEYLPLYSEEQARRHDVRPGITGWAQVNGRNSVDWPDRLAMDVWYVENQSFVLDLKILCMTVVKVILRKGITGEGNCTMTKFKGNDILSVLLLLFLVAVVPLSP